MKKTILLITFILAGLMLAQVNENDYRYKLADKYLKKGFVTKQQYDLFKKEFSVDTRKKKHTIMQIYVTFKLQMYGLLNNVGENYRLSEKCTRAEAARLLTGIMGEERKLAKSNTKSSFTDVPDQYAPYVGYLTDKGIIELALDKKFRPDDFIQHSEYAKWILNLLGYSEGFDYEKDKIDRFFSREKNFTPKPIGDQYLYIGKVMEINNYLLNRSFKGTPELFKTRLIKSGKLDKKKVEFVRDATYEYSFTRIRDKQTEVIYKYRNLYDFITTLDCRNGPAPIHPGLQWPDKNISLDYSGYIKIKDTGLGDKFYIGVIKDILKDLGLNSTQIERTISKYKADGKYMHIDYYTRAIKLNKRGKYYSLDFYLLKK